MVLWRFGPRAKNECQGLAVALQAPHRPGMLGGSGHTVLQVITTTVLLPIATTSSM